VIVLRVACVVGLAALLTGCGSASTTGTAPLPPDLRDDLVTRVGQPTALAFTPDGRLLVATKPGVLRVVTPDGRLLPRPALDLRDVTCTELERGMGGVAVDPAFERNRFVYIYYTHERDGRCPVRETRMPYNRLIRYELDARSVASQSTARVLLDRLPSFAAIHNGGGMQFGRDGLLYLGIGDGGRDYRGRGYRPDDNPIAADLDVLLGKIVRITRDGIPARGNPFSGRGSQTCARGPQRRRLPCREIFSWGVRNPFRLAFDPNRGDDRFFVNDVGSHTWEEVDEGRAGADYGWNRREGPCPQNIRVRCSPAPPGTTDPIFAYGHERGCRSITGGAFVPRGGWPSRYAGAYLYADFTCGAIFTLRSSRGALFYAGPEVAGPTDLRFDRSGTALYYSAFTSGEVRRIVPTTTPAASTSAAPIAPTTPPGSKES
jgi:glucose/arabinose dehydrogenase